MPPRVTPASRASAVGLPASSSREDPPLATRRLFVPGLIRTKQSLIPVKVPSASPSPATASGPSQPARGDARGRGRAAATPSAPSAAAGASRAPAASSAEAPSSSPSSQWVVRRGGSVSAAAAGASGAAVSRPAQGEAARPGGISSRMVTHNQRAAGGEKEGSAIRKKGAAEAPATPAPVSAAEQKGNADAEDKLKSARTAENATSESVQATTETYKAKTKTKVVVRLLPPSIQEEELLALVADPLKEKITWRRFFPGKQSKSGGKTGRNSIWYLNFTTAADAEDFIKSFHGKPVVDERHNVFKAVVRLAPYQKVPRKTGPDRREGTLENDPVYVEFLQALAEGAADAPRLAPPGTEELETVVDDDGVVLSSLVLALREKYGVKTLVKGSPYTLSMWRRAVVGESSRDEQAAPRVLRKEKAEEKARRGARSAKASGRGMRARDTGASIKAPEGTPAAGETPASRQASVSTARQSKAGDLQQLRERKAAASGSGRGGVWRALLGIQKRPSAPEGGAKAQGEEEKMDKA
ncbi:Smg-4/UPF3 family protein [Besnoitia besnoiti]|uniref:Smg-4/UPF3 family protein n=1 Tax=Besnoitia besnoiti TaxID=94643 RepID=A0A2A9ME61_BESBE|nr:Smg-4/UPF3 family protein [Besnoitia besnoiti]PFH33672.1 Smg-4/UPF3 family protein [Besnoitia besnoiti]